MKYSRYPRILRPPTALRRAWKRYLADMRAASQWNPEGTLTQQHSAFERVRALSRLAVTAATRWYRRRGTGLRRVVADRSIILTGHQIFAEWMRYIECGLRVQQIRATRRREIIAAVQHFEQTVLGICGPRVKIVYHAVGVTLYVPHGMYRLGE